MSAPATEQLLSTDIRLGHITRDVIAPTERMPSVTWWLAFLTTSGMLAIGVIVIYTLLIRGQGIFGISHPYGWAFDITNFVFWVGIGHAGTLISAILFLLRQKWRTAINRSAEAMTIFAVLTAGIFPLLHTGRQWVAYWLVPYPNDRLLWVNFRSPLLWDVFAVSTYLTISLLFWYTGLVPDFATMRDKAKNLFRKKFYGFLSLGWIGSMRDWNHYEKAYLLFAGMSTALVLSVHTVVSYDFATSILPGWHTTIFPPYFVAGAIFSGFAMVVTLLVIMRTAFRLEHLITIRHMEMMNKIILLTGMLVGYAYLTEFFIAWYSENPFERYVFVNRLTGPFAWAFYIMFFCNVVVPQVFWFKRMRTSIPVMFVISLLVNVGMWFERFNIIVSSLHRDFLPTNWDNFVPTIYDFGWTIGAFGLFFSCFLIFARVFPTVAMAEIKLTLPKPTDTSKVGAHG